MTEKDYETQLEALRRDLVGVIIQTSENNRRLLTIKIFLIFIVMILGVITGAVLKL